MAESMKLCEYIYNPIVIEIINILVSFSLAYIHVEVIILLRRRGQSPMNVGSLWKTSVFRGICF